jgi:hypothetical protein
MLGWIFNISIISLLIILIFHYAFDFFGTSENKSIDNLVDLKVQKYKNIIDAMVKEQKEKGFKKAYEEENCEPLSVEDDGLEELELYVKELASNA